MGVTMVTQWCQAQQGLARYTFHSLQSLLDALAEIFKFGISGAGFCQRYLRRSRTNDHEIGKLLETKLFEVHSNSIGGKRLLAMYR